MLKTQDRMKFLAEYKRNDRSYEHGDWIFLKLQPYWQKIMALRHNLKLAPRYHGPFKVLSWA